MNQIVQSKTLHSPGVTFWVWKKSDLFDICSNTADAEDADSRDLRETFKNVLADFVR